MCFSPVLRFPWVVSTVGQVNPWRKQKNKKKNVPRRPLWPAVAVAKVTPGLPLPPKRAGERSTKVCRMRCDPLCPCGVVLSVLDVQCERHRMGNPGRRGALQRRKLEGTNAWLGPCQILSASRGKHASGHNHARVMERDPVLGDVRVPAVSVCVQNTPARLPTLRPHVLQFSALAEKSRRKSPPPSGFRGQSRSFAGSGRKKH